MFNDDELYVFLPGRDGGEITSRDHEDEDEQKRQYSGKGKKAMMINRQNYIIGISDSREGNQDRNHSLYAYRGIHGNHVPPKKHKTKPLHM